jgi:hypothetical protein
VPRGRWPDEERPAVIVETDPGDEPRAARERPSKPGALGDPTVEIHSGRTLRIAAAVGVALALVAGGVYLWGTPGPTATTSANATATPNATATATATANPIPTVIATASSEIEQHEVMSPPTVESQPIARPSRSSSQASAAPRTSASAQGSEGPRRRTPDDFDDLKKGILH